MTSSSASHLQLLPKSDISRLFSTTPPFSTHALMFSRLSQITRHLSTPISQGSRRTVTSAFIDSRMAATADERSAPTIHTAACLIIGDEVLGGKVSCIGGTEGGMGANVLDRLLM